MPRPGEACSCYLIRTNDTSLLLDIGSGAFANLELAIEYARVGAIVVSHVHADHFFDLVPFRYALRYGHLPFERRIPLWLPPGGREALAALGKAVSSDAPQDFFESVFEVREYDPAEQLRVNDVPIRFARTRHFIEAYAARIESNGKSLTYSADTAPTDAVVELARGSSIFLCEATLGLRSESGERGHCSALEAGSMAASAGVEQLVLTHYPYGPALEALIGEARKVYRGPIAGAAGGLEVTV